MFVVYCYVVSTQLCWCLHTIGVFVESTVFIVESSLIVVCKMRHSAASLAFQNRSIGLTAMLPLSGRIALKVLAVPVACNIFC